MKRKLRTLTIISIILIVLLLAGCVLSVILALKMNEEKNRAEAFSYDIEDLDGQIFSLNQEISNLNAECADYTAQIEALKEEIRLLSDTKEQNDVLYAKLNEEIRGLEGRLTEKQGEIDELHRSIADLESYINIDINAQIELVNQLNALLASPPKHIVKEKLEKEDGTTEEITKEEDGIIALYYKDIENGYTFFFNPTWTTSSASMIKAPFALSILESYAAQDKRAAESETPIPEEELLPSLDTKFIYTEDKYRSGSGKIKEAEYGTEYTYRELIDYMLRYSDNVAYAELKEVYGIDAFRALASRLKLTSMNASLSNMSVKDACTIMGAIYTFCSENESYGPLMEDALKNANHTVMIPFGVWGTDCAHKYGWDIGAYHDMAIVYNDHPYTVSVMSNLDQGGDEVNQYIQQLIKLVAKMHANFYK
ncbi:MAG: serine hydrolase [Clostridia bacterium]|nr:serine hydrolase [Clostridia bacterium]MBQ4574362.1 serine hydrolase [Clostridia bacterium]